MPRPYALVAALALMVTPTKANQHMVAFLDGIQVGTFAGLVYELDTGAIRITTNEGVYGCQHVQVFRDRFEP